MRSRLVKVSAISVALLVAIGVWIWMRLPLRRLSQPVQSVFVGSEQARKLLPWRDKNAMMTSVQADVTGAWQAPQISGFTYLYLSSRDKSRTFVVRLSNARRLALLVTGEGLDVAAIQQQDPQAYTPIDLNAVKIDAEQALALAGERVAHEFDGIAPGDMQIDLRLGNAREGPVWYVQYDAWSGAAGPLAYGLVTIDARTGEVVAAQVKSAASQPTTDTQPAPAADGA